jgi:nucleoside-diphosphate-sugar epimerase
MASIVSKWIDNYNNGILQNDLFYGSENIKRDFVHIDNVNRVHLLLLKYFIVFNYLPYKLIIDVGSGVAVSFEQLANEILKHTKGKIRYIDNPFDESNYQFYTKANIDYLSATYNIVYGEEFKPIQIDEGIRLVFNKKTKNE